MAADTSTNKVRLVGFIKVERVSLGQLYCVGNGSSVKLANLASFTGKLAMLSMPGDPFNPNLTTPYLQPDNPLPPT